MLQFKKGNYTRKEVLYLQRILQHALDEIQCNHNDCVNCDYNRPCSDVYRLLSYLFHLLSVME